MISSFEKLNLNQNLMEGLKKQGINKPTDIQLKSIPLALENSDIIGQSMTGSGKTLAYLLPLYQKIDSSKREMQGIILAPTHELVLQIDKQIKLLSQNSQIPITAVPIIGKANIKRQVEKLRDKPHIIVGTTGRILELIKMKKIKAHTVKTIVIDEGDRMLDENNLSGVKDIIKTTQKDRQLMVFSATITDATINIAKELMKDALIIKIKEELLNPNISHMYFTADERDKIKVLRKLVASIKPNKAIIFINKDDKNQMITTKLRYHNINAYGIYGNASKEERKKALTGFRSGKIQLLIASDIAARGLDVKGVTHIINLDLPNNSKEYLHRVGRTGRAGNLGNAISIVTKKELPMIKRFERDFNIEIKEKEVFRGSVVDFGKGKRPVPKKKHKPT